MNCERAASDRQRQICSSANGVVATGLERGRGDVPRLGGAERAKDGGGGLIIFGGPASALDTPLPPAVIPRGMFACLGEWKDDILILQQDLSGSRFGGTLLHVMVATHVRRLSCC